MARLRSSGRKIATLLRVGPARQLLVAEAVASMLAARVAILIRPFAKVSSRFGTYVAPADPRIAAQRALRTPERAAIARQVGWAIRSAAPYMPFRSVCLQQAMAGHAMLRRRRIATVLHFGAGRKDVRAIDGHVWLDAEGVKVTGYPIADNQTEIACFVQSDADAPG